MKNITAKYLTLAVLLFVSMTLAANPATKQLIRITQQNRNLAFYLHGDEKLSCATTLDGYTLLAGSNGLYYYAVKDAQDNLVVSNVVAANAEERSKEEQSFLETLPKHLTFSFYQIKAAQQSIKPPYKDYPTTGNNPLLVILVSFPDRAFTTPTQDFQDLLSEQGYSANGGNGSVKDYYYDNSFGKLNLNPTVVGPVMLSHNMAFYGATGETFSDCNPKAMISEACSLVDSVIDFNDFDVNNDGILDAVHVIFAGQGQSTSGETDAIWPHRWSIYDSDTVKKYFDSVRLRDYSCSAEKGSKGNMDGIGTICHEFGHVLGLPDYYDADYAGSGGNATALGSWSVMASGSYNNGGKTPPIFNTNERMKVGWMMPDTLNTAGYYDIYPLIDSNKAYILTTGEADDYYLIENRSLDSWDSYIPNNGMLIYHIKSGNDNCVNCDPLFQRCDIVEADNDDTQGTLASDVFTYPSVNHYFTSYSTPHCFRWSDGEVIDKPVTQISIDTMGVVHFRYLIPDTSAIVNTLNGLAKHSSVSVSVKGYTVYEGINQNLTKGFLVADDYNMTSPVFYAATSYDADTFLCKMENLLYSHQYYYCAAAISSDNDTVRGNVNYFQTASGQPMFSSYAATDITVEGFTVNTQKLTEGDFPVTQYGMVYDTVSNIDTDGNVITYNGDFTSFSVTLTGLEQNTKYYCKAFAVTELGKKYGNTVTVTTKFIPVENNNIGENPEESCPNSLSLQITTQDVSGGAGDYTYLWQQSNNASKWQEAKGENNKRDYLIDSLTQSTYFRRIVYSHNITDISNVIFAKVNNSVGGTVTGRDSVLFKTADTLVLKNYKGTILGWQYNYSDQWEDIINSSDTNKIEMLYDKQGDVLIRATVQNGVCPSVYSDTLHVYVQLTGALTDTDNRNMFVVSPNPVNDVLNISSGGAEINSVAIYDINGKLITQKNLLITQNISLITQNIPAGTYLLIINGQEKIKFVVSR